MSTVPLPLSFLSFVSPVFFQMLSTVTSAFPLLLFPSQRALFPIVSSTSPVPVMSPIRAAFSPSRVALTDDPVPASIPLISVFLSGLFMRVRLLPLSAFSFSMLYSPLRSAIELPVPSASTRPRSIFPPVMERNPAPDVWMSPLASTSLVSTLPPAARIFPLMVPPLVRLTLLFPKASIAVSSAVMSLLPSMVTVLPFWALIPSLLSILVFPWILTVPLPAVTAVPFAAITSKVLAVMSTLWLSARIPLSLAASTSLPSAFTFRSLVPADMAVSACISAGSFVKR